MNPRLAGHHRTERLRTDTQTQRWTSKLGEVLMLEWMVTCHPSPPCQTLVSGVYESLVWDG